MTDVDGTQASGSPTGTPTDGRLASPPSPVDQVCAPGYQGRIVVNLLKLPGV